MEAINPATGEQISTYEKHPDEEIDRTLETAVETFQEWSERPLREREELLANAADVLRENKTF
jgi:succinate-semialdehyde dehydrogenase/glutarate-semialdehyde dehydrogenase